MGRPFSPATDAFVKLARSHDWTSDLAAVVIPDPPPHGVSPPGPPGSESPDLQKRS
jgi:hypothetical protein